MAATFVIKQNDLLPRLEVTLLDGAAAVDLTTAGDVRFVMRNLAGIKVDRFLTVTDQSEPANRGKVYLLWEEGDTDTVGVFKAEVEVTWPGGNPQTFPADGYFRVKVVADLDDDV